MDVFREEDTKRTATHTDGSLLGPALVFILTLFSAIQFVTLGHLTAFEWPTAQYISLIMRILDPNFLPHDFYTSSVIDSPLAVFAYLNYFLVQTGLSWYEVLYLLKVLYIIMVPPLLFVTMKQIFNIWSPKSLSRQWRDCVLLILAFFACGLLTMLQDGGPAYSPPYWGSPVGWGAIQAYMFISPMAIAFVLGLFYNYMRFCSSDRIGWLSPFILLISTFFHPVIGLCHFTLILVFYLPFFYNKTGGVRVLIDGLIGCIFPIVSLMIIYKSPEALDAETFIKQYVYIRHAPHYLMSEAIVWGHYFNWFILWVIPFYFSVKLRNKKLIVMSVMTLMLFFVGPPLVQFLGTEVWKIKQIAILGPSRFTAYISIVWGIQCAIVMAYAKGDYSKYLSWMVRFFERFLVKLKEHFRFKTLLTFYLVFFTGVTTWIWAATLKHPLDFYRTNGIKDVVKWIEGHTNKKTTFFLKGMTSAEMALIRIYGNRAIFADYSVPFNESASTEFTERLLILKKAKTFTASDYRCLAGVYPLDYVLVPLKDQKVFEHSYTPVFSSKKWLVYNVSHFKKVEPCHKKDFLSE